ncbi:uncharacterized protein GGS25DRAFT_525490 [Hypoxylon fragiforme]|uniref:uncharacterized protein n=1 Tax=Hypoxylon fragiforme TaxID=63214 RepID=UPI0020C7184F|nr:uncharacterized protein GGS25DRAFT_525490 [Hypoxylon fragiforme]KAI2604213.1 hypothetical protein GGS25DRAFT_525490 [Hypoxylon fragiforme]
MIVPASSSKHHRIDITTALMQNHPPHYALPADLLPVLPVLSLESSSQMNNITALMLSISPAMSSVVHVFHDLKRLAAWLEAQSSMPDIERDCLFAYALAALAIIILLRRKLDSFSGALPSYLITIPDALRNSEMDDPKFLVLRLWLLTISGISTTERDEREGAQVGLVVEMRAAGLQSWRDVMELAPKYLEDISRLITPLDVGIKGTRLLNNALIRNLLKIDPEFDMKGVAR